MAAAAAVARTHGNGGPHHGARSHPTMQQVQVVGGLGQARKVRVATRGLIMLGRRCCSCTCLGPQDPLWIGSIMKW